VRDVHGYRLWGSLAYLVAENTGNRCRRYDGRNQYFPKLETRHRQLVASIRHEIVDLRATQSLLVI